MMSDAELARLEKRLKSLHVCPLCWTDEGRFNFFVRGHVLMRDDRTPSLDAIFPPDVPVKEVRKILKSASLSKKPI